MSVLLVESLWEILQGFLHRNQHWTMKPLPASETSCPHTRQSLNRAGPRSVLALWWPRFESMISATACSKRKFGRATCLEEAPSCKWARKRRTLNMTYDHGEETGAVLSTAHTILFQLSRMFAHPVKGVAVQKKLQSSIQKRKHCSCQPLFVEAS